MDLPEELVRGQIKEGKVYRFYDSVPTGSNIIPNHWHICFKINEEIVYLVCCTTKEGTIDSYIKVNKLDTKTKVYIAPTADNGLTKDTYLNCNSIQMCDFEELVKSISKSKVTYSGFVSKEDFDCIRIGIRSSAVVPDAIKKLVLNK